MSAPGYRAMRNAARRARIDLLEEIDAALATKAAA